jgi:hypothetical protein
MMLFDQLNRIKAGNCGKIDRVSIDVYGAFIKI